MDFSRRPRGFNTATKAREYDQLSRDLLSRAELVCRHLLPDGKKVNGEWRVGSIQGERGKSMGVNLSTGVWKDFDGGPGGNDLISLWAEKKGISNHEAYDEASGWLGIGTTRPEKPTPWTKNSPTPTKTAESKPDDDTMWWRKMPATKKWDYFDDSGELWVTVCRFERPGEKIIRPWDHKAQDWKWPEGARPLFGLADIRQSPGPVFLVEGEKCADRLRELGYTATTMPGGSNAARVIDWRPLAGREVVRWADNDHLRTDKRVACEIWNEKTLEHLTQAGVRIVRDVAVPAGKPDGWDCADADDDTINRLIATALDAAPVYEGSGPFETTHWDFGGALFAGKGPEQRWLVENIIPLGKPGVFAAQGDAGKSMLMLDLAMKICMTPANPSGTHVPASAFGHPVMSGGRCVLYFAEDDKDELHRRASAMDPTGDKRRACAGKLFAIPFPDAGGPPQLIAGDERSVSSTAAFDMIRKQLLAIKDLRLVVIDPATPFVSGDLNKPHIAGAFATMLAQLSAQTGATIIVTHHMSKGDRTKPISSPEEARHAVRGAAAFVDGTRFTLVLWPTRESEARNVLSGKGREWERNAIYSGAVVKANGRADRRTITFVRNADNGVLEPQTAQELAEARKTARAATPAGMRYLWALVKYRQERSQSTYFGKNFHLLTRAGTDELKRAGFVKPDERDLLAILELAEMSKKPSWGEVSRAADAIIHGSQDEDAPRPIVWTGKALEVVGAMP